MWLELTYRATNNKILVNMGLVQSVVRRIDDAATVLYYHQANDDNGDYGNDEVVETVEFIREKLMWK